MRGWGTAALAATALGLAACATPASAPHDGAAYADFLVGRMANLRADHPAAAERYFAALARSPGNPALIEGALTASLAAGDPAGARRAARMAPRQDAPAYAHIVRGADAIAARRFGAARAELARVEGASAEERIGFLLELWARAGQGEIEDLGTDLGPLVSLGPYGGLFAYQRAMALDHIGRDQQALAAYEAAQQGGMWLPAAVMRHADLLVRRGARDQAAALLSDEPSRQNPALAAALARLEAGGAVAETPLTPAHGAAAGLYGLSAIFAQEYDGASALTTLTLALMLDPGFDGARLALAQRQSALGRTEAARASLALVPQTSPYAAGARIMEAWILQDAGDEAGALELARANAQTGDALALRTLADMYRGADRHAEAEPIYTQLIAEDPDNWRYYFARGATRERLGRWSEAEADFMRALELSPDQPDVLNYLGYSWIDRGENLQEGLAMIQRALELRPNSGAIIDSLGWAYYRLGDYAQALDLLEAAVRLEPADPTLNDHLGDVYWRLGRRTEARYQWQRALSLEPDDPEGLRAKLEAGLPDAQSARR